MQRIADKLHHWYCNENPQCLDMAQLAKVFQAQHYAGENDLQGLKRVIAGDAWTVNYPWTAQGWLPITQAASTHGDRQTVAFLLASGADAPNVVLYQAELHSDVGSLILGPCRRNPWSR
jgi:hypothetical protein